MPPEQQEPATFNFDRLVFERISLETLPLVPPSEGETLAPGILADMKPRGDIEIDHDGRRVRVLLGFKITPDPKKQAYVIIVEVVGVFSLKTGTIEQLTQFAKGGAASVLFPYVRQMVSTITRDGRWGPMLLNPVNVQTMLKWQDNPMEEDATDSTAPSQPSPQSPSGEQDLEN